MLSYLMIITAAWWLACGMYAAYLWIVDMEQSSYRSWADGLMLGVCLLGGAAALLGTGFMRHRGFRP